MPLLSLVIPIFNEAESLLVLHRQLNEALKGWDGEVIFIDDGSSDASPRLLDDLRRNDPRVRVIRFGRHWGKAEALAVGFKEARGEVIVTLDGDLQDDPAEIPRLVVALDDGYDLVSGWKSPRHDPLTKTLPSVIFNWVTARLTGLPLHDFNSGFKAYRRRVIEAIPLYGEQHRFIPVLAYGKGFRVGEIKINHRPRLWGRSKFGVERLFAGLFDLLTVVFLTRFRRKPLHLFGLLGLISFALGFIINLYLTIIWLGGESIGRRPLLLLGALLVITGIQLLSLGLLGEMLSLGAARGEEPFYEILESSSRAESPPAQVYRP